MPFYKRFIVVIKLKVENHDGVDLNLCVFTASSFHRGVTRRRKQPYHRWEKSGRADCRGRGQALWCVKSSSNRERPYWFCVFSKLEATDSGWGVNRWGKEATQQGRQGGGANTSCFTRSVSTVETWPQDFSWGESVEFCRTFFPPLLQWESLTSLSVRLSLNRRSFPNPNDLTFRPLFPLNRRLLTLSGDSFLSTEALDFFACSHDEKRDQQLG